MTSIRRIIVTGATGALGRHLTERLAERGDHVIAFTRDPERARRQIPAASEFVRWSASMSDGDWRSTVDGADAVVSLAGRPLFTRWTDTVKRQIHDSRIDGTRHLVDAIAAAASRPSVLVGASGIGYYGAAPHGRVVENSPAGTDFLARVCAEWEAEARRAEDFGVRVATIRTSPVLEHNEGMLGILAPIFRLGLGGPVAGGRQPFPWIHWEDEVRVILLALDDSEVEGPINAVAPERVTNGEFTRALGRVLHRPTLLPVPRFGLRLIFADAAEAFAGGQDAVPGRLEQLGFEFLHPKLEPALQEEA